jgi:hypothetical protein
VLVAPCTMSSRFVFVHVTLTVLFLYGQVKLMIVSLRSFISPAKFLLRFSFLLNEIRLTSTVLCSVLPRN